MKRGILLGRFQPFHLGHLSAVQDALREVEELIIVIGSAEKSHEQRNPFTAGERLSMIRQSLEDAEIDPKKWMIIPVPDASSHALWTAKLDMLVPRYHVAFTNDPLSKRLFEEKGVKVREVQLKKRSLYSATEVRRRLSAGRGWETLVPKSVVKIIGEIKGVERVRELVHS